MEDNHLNLVDRHLILFIEDQLNPTTIKVIARAGFRVEEAKTAWRAFFLLKTRAYAAVILDLAIGVKEKDTELLQEIEEKGLLDEVMQQSFAPLGIPKWVPGVRLLELILAGKFAGAGNGSDLPVVVVSGVALEDVQERVDKLLGKLAEKRYFLKPVSPEKMVAALQKALDIA
jgi:DNA-binding response OmpR family regulator